MTKEEKDECLHKLGYIINRANWGTIDRDENGLPLGIRYASDVATAIENDNQADLLKEFVGFVEDRLTIWIKDENYQANIAEAENDNLRKNMSLLMAETIEVIKNSMKPALKKFLEERK